jgi:hypothetical protein
MTSDWREDAFHSVLKAIDGGPPRDLISRVQPDAADRGDSITTDDLTAILRAASEANPFLGALGMQVHKWDAADPQETWTRGTEASTEQRRNLASQLLGIDSAGEKILLERRPIFHDETIVITAPWNRWYTAERAAQRAFYWPRYRDYLLTMKQWEADNVTSLDLATTDVVERLTDPTRQEAYQAKGLVVGYVQSGKTANFTGVMAKAIDAGYRLIIVMTGTIELLRVQTQRRVDMEMVGRQNILGDIPLDQAADYDIDYNDDEDWIRGRFLDLGQETLTTEIHRLTQHKVDYQKLGAQFKSLKIERAAPALPLFNPENLFKAHARLAIVKKNATVLKKLVADVKANRTAFAEIPVLIIDDESDEASINVVDPERVLMAKAEGKEIAERNAINQHIANMLELMPRAQYVGYTATPFANVFVDPSDPLGIFPKDFAIGLRRPPGYMGVDDFYDIDPLPDGQRTFENSNQAAFVRDLDASDDDVDAQDNELRLAIDMFVLSGAAKMFRADRDESLVFRHHTMLVHHSVKIDDHKALAERIRTIWASSEYSQASGRERLRERYDDDVLPVSRARVEPDLPPLPEFELLASYIPKTLAKVTEHKGNPVIVVNSDMDVEQERLDFDKTSTWRILVGGAKLSRGFTVEGLTVTYFRRATDMSASLTQMGRWFGFRHGYRDLVRLFIARRAMFKRAEVDLYDAFGGVAMDEAAFRRQLERYAAWDGDHPRVLPSQIPPLVTQHLSWLRPVARNKMFNAVLEEQSEQPFTPTGYPNHVDQLKQNLNLWRATIALAHDQLTLSQGASYPGDFDAYIGVVGAEDLVDAIDACGYLPLYAERAVNPKTTFYRRLITAGSLKDFLVVMPQPASGVVEIADIGARSTVSRDRRSGRGGRFGEITDPKHRHAVEAFTAVGDFGVSGLERWASPGRGALLLYLAKETKPRFEHASSPDLPKADPEYGLVVAFSAYVPSNCLAGYANLIRFRVRDVSQAGLPIVDAHGQGQEGA